MALKMMPGKVAEIVWNTGDDRKVSEVSVFNFAASSDQAKEQAIVKYIASTGADSAGWMEGHPQMTPEALFTWWVRDGFADEFVLLQALDQLGQIEEAPWARSMAAGLRASMIQERGGEMDRGEDARLDDPLYEPA